MDQTSKMWAGTKIQEITKIITLSDAVTLTYDPMTLKIYSTQDIIATKVCSKFENNLSIAFGKNKK